MERWVVKYRNAKEIGKTVQRMRPSTQVAFYRAVDCLKMEGPRPKGWFTKVLKGSLRGKVALRLDYRHRMIYEVYEGILTICILQVSSRADAY